MYMSLNLSLAISCKSRYISHANVCTCTVGDVVRDQRSEIRGERSEIRGERSEIRGERSEIINSFVIADDL